METVSDWLNEVDSAKKREKDFRKDGQDIEKIYEDGEKHPFNILYSNTETLLPAVFSNLPRPVINRRHKDKDPLGMHAAEAGKRMLEYLMDTDHDEYEKFSDAIESTVLDGLLPGRGIASVKYDAYVSDDPENPDVSNEIVCADSRPWDRVFFGYAKKWSKVPWVCYEEYLDREECQAKGFDEGILATLNFTEDQEAEEDNSGSEEDREKGSRKTITVYQIWIKAVRKIIYITPQYKDAVLKEEDDPLGLSGFYNLPKPIEFIKTTRSMTPKALYKLYETQAQELNRVQRRLNKVIEAIKVRGAYDGNLGDVIEQVLKYDDNALVASDKSATMLNQGGFDKSIWMLPLGELMTVAQQLYQARESSKQVIYEITGISDIIRGQSRASETLGAQKIKESWGTMRLKRLQKEVQRYVLDLLKIMLEIAISQFSEEMWAEITNLKFPSEQEKMQAQQAQMQPQNPQQPKQPLDPKIQEILDKPTWKDVIGLLQNDKLRMYRIDIETNSTLDIEATEDKQQIGEFMNAMAQFMNGIQPMIDKGQLDFEVGKSMFMEMIRRFRFSREVEEQLEKMKPREKKDPKAEMKKLQEMKKQLDQAKQAMEKQKQSTEDQMRKAGKQLEDQARQLEIDKMQFEYEQKLAKETARVNAQAKQATDQAQEQQMVNQIKGMIDKSETKTQSMIDKFESRLRANQ